MNTSPTTDIRFVSPQRVYWKRISDKESKRAKRGLAKRHADMLTRPADSDTMRWRARQDLKGEPVGHIYIGEKYYMVTHSTGRADQFDVFLGDKNVFRGGANALGIWQVKQWQALIP